VSTFSFNLVQARRPKKLFFLAKMRNPCFPFPVNSLPIIVHHYSPGLKLQPHLKQDYIT